MEQNISEKEVMAIPTPEWTNTWHPVGHGDVIRAMKKGIKETGMNIVTKRYDVTKNGGNLFASWTLDHNMDGIEGQWVIGFRNSIIAQLSLGMVSGNFVIVCSNLQFSGKFIEFKKHSGLLTLDYVNEMAVRTALKMPEELQTLEKWHSDLRNFPIDKVTFKRFTYDLMKSDAIPPSQFKKFVTSYEEEAKINKCTLFSVHGAATRVLRNDSLVAINRRSKILNNRLETFKAVSKEREAA